MAKKKVSYELIPPKSDAGKRMYPVLEQLIEDYHDDLMETEARIALAWCTSWKPNTDGRLILGRCKRASDLDRELMGLRLRHPHQSRVLRGC